jgi:hypothetical protein
MDGLTVLSNGAAGSFNPGPSWQIKGSGDFNGDGRSDILWQGSDGTPAIWLMDGLTALSNGPAGSFNPGPSWHVVGAGQFGNGDIKSDIMWQADFCGSWTGRAWSAVALSAGTQARIGTSLLRRPETGRLSRAPRPARWRCKQA